MTDKEIIEFWEHIAELAESCDPTAKIPLSVGSARETYRLIKRLKREHKIYKNQAKVLTEKLEALGDPLQDAHYKIAEQQAEIKRLQNERIERIRELTREVYDKEIAEAKSEAIKEFAEMLKGEYIFALLKDGSVRKIIPNYAIDYVVKEMVGDAE